LAQKSLAKPSAPVPLDRKFWHGFAKNHWEKKPLFVKNLQSSLREISADEVFNLLVLYSDHCRKLNNPEGFKFYIGGFKCGAEDVLQVLPEKTDKSLLGYHARMQALFSDYCLVCDELLSVNHKKQHLLTDFTDELYRHVGFPNRFSEMGLYLGNYRKTPFGIHVDSCGVFSFPVVGTKSFRLWTSAYAKKNPGLDRAFKYDKYKKDSQLLQASPGDMTYWPSSAWHIAESDGSFSATWSLGVWVNQPHKELLSESLKDLIEKKSGAAADTPTTHFKTLHSGAGEVTELPESYLQAIDWLQKLSLLELQESFLKSWMKHISLQGFKTVPRIDFKISAKSHIQLRHQRSLVLWQQSLTSKKNIIFSFGGVLVESAKSKDLLKLIKALNAGEACQISSYLKGPHKKKDLAALQMLADAGAFS
jgi:ribosomal protein L16 Arg81 hydroxylase